MKEKRIIITATDKVTSARYYEDDKLMAEASTPYDLSYDCSFSANAWDVCVKICEKIEALEEEENKPQVKVGDRIKTKDIVSKVLMVDEHNSVVIKYNGYLYALDSSEYEILPPEEEKTKEPKPPRDTDFKVGDRVRFRSWDDMVEEFGVEEDKDGSLIIPCTDTFIEDMKFLCGTEATVTYIYGQSVGLKDFSTKNPEHVFYTFTKDMIEKIK